jgi:hypothetical protein
MGKWPRHEFESVNSSPQNLPVESLSLVEWAVNLKTAQAIGVSIPQAVRLRAGEVIQ